MNESARYVSPDVVIIPGNRRGVILGGGGGGRRRRRRGPVFRGGRGRGGRGRGRGPTIRIGEEMGMDDDSASYETDDDTDGDESVSEETSGEYEEPEPAKITPKKMESVYSDMELALLERIHKEVMENPEAGMKVLSMEKSDCGMCGKGDYQEPPMVHQEPAVCEVHVHHHHAHDYEEPPCKEEKKHKKKKDCHKKKHMHDPTPVVAKNDCDGNAYTHQVETTDDYDCWMQKAHPCDEYAEQKPAYVCSNQNVACHPFNASMFVRKIKACDPASVQFSHRYVANEVLAEQAKLAGKAMPEEALQYIHVDVNSTPVKVQSGKTIQFVDMKIVPISADGRHGRDSATDTFRIYKIKTSSNGTQKVSLIEKNLNAMKESLGDFGDAAVQAHGHMLSIFGRNFK